MAREIRITLSQGHVDGLRVRDAEIDPATVDAWCREAASIRIPLVDISTPPCADGAVYTLSSGVGATANVIWYGDGPREWSELTTWARSIMKRLHDRTSPEEPLNLEG